MANTVADACRVCASGLPRRRNLYCSRACRNTGVAAAKRIHKLCVVCGATFDLQPSKTNRQVACSDACQTVYRRTRNIARHARSQQPEAKRKRQETFLARRLVLPCGCGCGSDVTVIPSKIKNNVSGRVFINREHYETWFRGENVTRFWLGGDGPEYYGPTWSIQRKRALQRDQVCQHCGTDEDIVVHHKRFFRDCADYREANVLSNLIVLCRRCHLRVHATHTASSEAARQ
jgi:5-methylcytosine-specific restriction endonuclease McrA